MRVRVQTSTPLPPAKFWFASDGDSGVNLFKKSLARSAPLSKHKLNEENLVLELDGFELLDDFSMDQLVKDGDLLVVKQRISAASKKRKAESFGTSIGTFRFWRC